MFRKHKFRVLFAISNLTYGGIQTQTLSLAKEMQKKGAKIYFLWTTKAEKEFVENELLKNNFKIIDGRYIENNSLQKYSWTLYRYVPLVRTIFLLRRYNINYILPYQTRLSYFFGAIHKYTGAKKTVFHIRNTVLENYPKKNWHLQQALENKLTIISNSEHARIKFKNVYGELYDLNIQTVYNGINVRAIDKSINWKKHFGVESSEFVGSVIANFFKEKDFITIFKAWKCFIETSKSNSCLLIAGDEGTEGMRNYYKNQIKELRLENHVKFLGRTPLNIELLSITNCNILSTINEGLPNTAIETLAMGKPLLATDIDGVREVVGEGYPIPLFPVGNYKELTNRLLKIFNNEYNLEQVKEYSWRRSEKFSVEELIENYSRILEL
ncbi:glycosyltransferase [Aequorivita xiaoshiensis]|uniref:Glycosyltransferase n=1 Tax=Aequorivita xiaoshiensis TaxID=2874476 RepID=A0A9X1U4R4_9FLAO|nr:glycosyltransferase [Aequorivita xiaoshiensis]MCG2432089.1 glycosyltransferase [Aequorivita xiaoshiensis]